MAPVAHRVASPSGPGSAAVEEGVALRPLAEPGLVAWVRRAQGPAQGQPRAKWVMPAVRAVGASMPRHPGST